jgi:hypothetical protein
MLQVFERDDILDISQSIKGFDKWEFFEVFTICNLDYTVFAAKNHANLMFGNN